jgi:beta-lactamase superfamily II metal-dependent hydrolase
MKSITGTAYNVGFGDTTLVEFPDSQDGHTNTRRILIDMGNVSSGEGGDIAVFQSVAEDLRGRIGEGAIDLFVMTHEHLDHVRGLRYLASLGQAIPFDYVWLTSSANPHYGRRYPKAEVLKRLMATQALHLTAQAQVLGLEDHPARAYMAINNPNNTGTCVDFIRKMARVRRSYVHNRYRIIPGKHHPFHEAKIAVWAPEPDTSTYYGRFVSPVPRVSNRQRYPKTPPGVDPKAFRNLMDSLQSGFGENILAIDKAANNTSIVLCIEWRGWRLLFTGDAERRSWQEMAKRKVLKEVHFLKISHHGSHNGTPSGEILDSVLPKQPHDDKPRSAILSTWPDTYNGVPDEPTVARIADRVDVLRTTRSVPLGGSVRLDFESR